MVVPNTPITVVEMFLGGTMSVVEMSEGAMRVVETALRVVGSACWTRYSDTIIHMHLQYLTSAGTSSIALFFKKLCTGSGYSYS